GGDDRQRTRAEIQVLRGKPGPHIAPGPGPHIAPRPHSRGGQHMKPPSMQAKIVIAAAGALLLAAVAVRYTEAAAQRGQNPAASQVVSTDEENLSSGPKMQVLTNGRLSLVPRDHPDGPRTVTDQACDRAYAAAGTAVCLRPVDAFTGTHLVSLDPQLH